VTVSTSEEVKIQYDPYAHRDLEHPNRYYTLTSFNLIINYTAFSELSYT